MEYTIFEWLLRGNGSPSLTIVPDRTPGPVGSEWRCGTVTVILFDKQSRTKVGVGGVETGTTKEVNPTQKEITDLLRIKMKFCGCSMVGRNFRRNRGKFVLVHPGGGTRISLSISWRFVLIKKLWRQNGYSDDKKRHCRGSRSESEVGLTGPKWGVDLTTFL